MKKILPLLFVILFNLACVQSYAETELPPSQASLVTNANLGDQERILALHKANIHDMIVAHGQRVEDLQFQQMQFITFLSIGVAILLALFAWAMNNKLKSLRREVEDQKELIKGKMELLDDMVNMSRNRVKGFQADMDTILQQAKQKIDAQADTASLQISERLNNSLQEAKNKLGEIANEHNKVSKLVKEIEEHKEQLTPELKKRLKEQVEETNKIKLEKEYTAQDWFLKGHEAYGKDQYEEAANCYKQATELDTNNATYYNDWGTALSNLDKHLEAIDKYKKAIEIDPSDATCYNNIGYSYAQLGEDEKAVENFHKSLVINPQFSIPYRHWGNMLIKQKQYVQAVEKFEKAINIEPAYKLAYLNWDKALEGLKETNPELYGYKVEEFKRALQQNKELEGLKYDNRFQEIYIKYFPY